MKISEKMRFPHPVLSEFSTDYVTGELQSSFMHQITEDGQLKIISTLELDCENLLQLIEDKKAALGYFIVCRRTYFNRMERVAAGQSDRYFSLSDLHGQVILRPVIWTIADIDNISSPLIHEEFGDDLPVQKGSVIAMGPEFRFSIDPVRFKPFESVFSLAVDDEVEAGTIAVDPEADRITILAEKVTHRKISDLRNIAPGRTVLLNAVYLPVVMEVIARLQNGDNSLQGYRWFRVFSAKCDELSIRPDDPKKSTVEMAQTLLRAPVQHTIKMMEST